MAAPENHWKLGLFVVSAIAATFATVAVIGARSMKKEVSVYMSYFDESVQGLEVGSPIKFRGVTVGTVGKIEVAPDHRHVAIESELGTEELTRLGLDRAAGPTLTGDARTLQMASDLRIQLASSGLTGVKFLQLDFFDPVQYPPPTLPFPAPDNVIPTAPSTMKNLEDLVTRVANRLPEIVDKTASILGGVEEITLAVADTQLPQHVAETLQAIDGIIVTTRRQIDRVDVSSLSREATLAIVNVRDAVKRLDGFIVGLGRKRGLIASMTRASDAVGGSAGEVVGVGASLTETLVSIQDTARSIRRFTDALEQDPDMLLKGLRKDKSE
jgi:phospholipid/cholesterol/gamma-HCH transport system substrate-binding protein